MKEQSSLDNRNIHRNSVIRIALKAIVLFLALNLLWAWLYPVDTLGKISAYNIIFPGRKRLPYGDVPEKAYNLSLFNLNAMFTSHELHGKPKAEDEFRVLLVGDSSTWGYLLPADQTLAEYLNQANLTIPVGKQVQVYNLGYPVMSLTKDLLILSESLHYQPDLIVWLVTLESFPREKQLFPPLLQHNSTAVKELINLHQLNLDSDDPALIETSFRDRLLFLTRRELADLIRLQLYGVMWASTGIDQYIPGTFTPRQEQLSADTSFHDWIGPPMKPGNLSFDILQAGIDAAGSVPVLIVNEPMFVSQGENSDIRYNYYYPRWAYDEYLALMHDYSAQNDWNYLDLWNAIPSNEFTNTAVHLSAQGTQQLANLIASAILQIADDQP